MFVQFGIGFVFINPITGNLPVNPTAQILLGVQDASWDVDQKLVELKGNLKGPDDVATADMTVKGKFKMGRTDQDVFNNTYFAEPITVGVELMAPQEKGTVPAITTFTITVTNSATWTKDLGVRYQATQQPLTNVGAGTLTAAGQYKVALGVYTFFSADASAKVFISYVYTQVTGQTLTVHNQIMGYGPVCEVYVWQPYSSPLNASLKNSWRFYAVRFGKMTQAIKRDDFTYPEMEWEAFPLANGNWFDINDGRT